eukprot:GEMP01003036.1.p1 GENE.GEMP01003036.1~~GEMP01003036.1.p1  ORF type:complete len:1246 (+),score=249.74 GEMP01003036.1:62-3799(+)
MVFRVEIQYCANCENHSWCTHHSTDSYAARFRSVAEALRSQFNCVVEGVPSHTIGAFEVVLVQDQETTSCPPVLVFSKLGCGKWPPHSLICDVVRGVLEGRPVPPMMMALRRPRTLKRLGPQPHSSRKMGDSGEMIPGQKSKQLSALSKMHLAEKRIRPLSPIESNGTPKVVTQNIMTPRIPSENQPDTLRQTPRKQSGARRVVKKQPKQGGEPEDCAVKNKDCVVKKRDSVEYPVPKPPTSKPAKSSPQRPPSKAKASQRLSKAAPTSNTAGASATPTSQTAGSGRPVTKVNLGGDGNGFEVQVRRSDTTFTGDIDYQTECESKIIVFTPGGVVQGNVGIDNGRGSSMEDATKKTRIKRTGDIQKLEYNDDVLDLSVHRDWVACAGESDEIVVWDYKTNQKMFTRPVNRQITTIAFSLSGQYLAMADSMGKLVLFSANSITNSFDEINTYQNNSVEREDVGITCVAFSPSDDQLSIGDMDRKVMLVSLPELIPLAELAQADDVHSLSFSHSGNYLASGGGGDRQHGLYSNKSGTSDMRVVIWKTETENSSVRFLGQCIFDDVVYVTRFSPNSEWLAVGTDDACVSLLHVENNFEKRIELAASAGIRCMCWSPDSRFLAVGGVAKQVDVWDLTAKQLTFSLPMAKDWITAVAFGSDMRNIFMSSFGEPVHIYSLEWENLDFQPDPLAKHGTGTSVKKMRSHLEMSANGKSNRFQRVDLSAENEETFTVIVANEQCMRRPSLLQTPPGTLVISSSLQRFARPALNVVMPGGKREEAYHHHRRTLMEQGQIIRLRADDFPEIDNSMETFRCEEEVTALSISRDGSMLAFGGEDCTVTLIQSRDKKVIWRRPHKTPITCMAWSRCGGYLACGGEHGSVGIWNAVGEEIATAENFAEDAADLRIQCIQFSPNSKLLAWGDLDKKVTLVSVPDMEQIAELVHEGDLRSVSFSPMGTMLAGGGGTDRQHGLMDTKLLSAQMKTLVWSHSSDPDSNSHGTWKMSGTIISPNVVTCVEFSPDEQFLAIGDDGRKLEILLPHQSFKKFIQLELPASVTCLAWSPCGCFVLVGAACRSISIFHVLSHTLIKILPPFRDWVAAISFAPTYKFFAVIAHDENVYIFRLQTPTKKEGDDDSARELTSDMERNAIVEPQSSSGLVLTDDNASLRSGHATWNAQDGDSRADDPGLEDPSSEIWAPEAHVEQEEETQQISQPKQRKLGANKENEEDYDEEKFESDETNNYDSDPFEEELSE